jgi:YbbR domain-containing protein
LKAKKSLIERLTDDWLAKVLSLAAAIFIFWLFQNANMKQGYFQVPLKAVGAGRMVPAGEIPEFVHVAARGDPGKVEYIKPSDFEAYVDLSGVDAEGTRVLPVKLRLLGNALETDPLEVTVDPIQVKVPFEARETKYVPVEARFSGAPQTGYEKASVQVSPGKAEVSGPRGLVERIQSLATEPYDLSGLDADSRAVLPLALPSTLVELSGAKSVEVRVEVRQAFAKKTFDYVPIALIGLSSRLAVDGKLPGGSLTVYGTQAEVDAFVPGEDTMFIDLTAVSRAGALILPVQVHLPPELTVAEKDPAELQVKITERAPQ